MAGHTKWRDLRAEGMTPERDARVRGHTEAMLRELPLQELRRARELSQVTLAEALGATQPEVSRIEHRVDLYVSTLRKYIEAMGGELEIIARFPDGAVRISQFEDLAQV
ncbi:MAG: XRE family transcriptional regulator [Gemmatimonadaceae bacterium]